MTRRVLAGGFELDDDAARVDLTAVHRYLSEDSYWAKGRPFETVERLVRDASRVVGLYDAAGALVGFCRAVSDGETMAYLADVFVLPEHHGKSLGTELVREMVENGALQPKRWLLHTADAHGLYEKFGFGAPSERVMERGPAT